VTRDDAANFAKAELGAYRVDHAPAKRRHCCQWSLLALSESRLKALTIFCLKAAAQNSDAFSIRSAGNRHSKDEFGRRQYVYSWARW